MNKAIILLSGGIDSYVCAEIAKEWGYELYALSFDYGQKHISELKAASVISSSLNVVEHKILTIPTLSAITNEQPYVPARNTIFLSLALGYAETIGATDLFIGINSDDTYFPDCSPRFYHAFNSLAAVALKKRVRLNAPVMKMTKSEIIKKGAELGVDFSKTITCYEGGYCGRCPACKTRMKGFHEAGINDPNLCLA